MPKSNNKSFNVNIKDVLAKPYGLINKKDHTFGEALDHFAAKVKSLPSIKKHQKMLLDCGLFLIELKAQIPDTKQYSDFIADTDFGQLATARWGANAPTELSKLSILATQAKHVKAFIEAGVSDSVGGSGLLKAYNAYAAKPENDLPKAEGQQRKDKANKPSAKPKGKAKPSGEPEAPQQTGNSSESQSGKTDKPAVQQTAQSDEKPSTHAIVTQLVDVIIGYNLDEDEEGEVLTKLLAAFNRDLPEANTADMGSANVTSLSAAMQKAQAAS